MPGFFDPLRQRIPPGSPDGRPCWLAARVALPAIHILPCVESKSMWQVEILLDGSWVGGIFGIGAIVTFLIEWQLDPEAALRKWFKREPPTRQTPTLPPVVRTSAGQSGATAEELDL